MICSRAEGLGFWVSGLVRFGQVWNGIWAKSRLGWMFGNEVHSSERLLSIFCFYQFDGSIRCANCYDYTIFRFIKLYTQNHVDRIPQFQSLASQSEFRKREKQAPIVNNHRQKGVADDYDRAL